MREKFGSVEEMWRILDGNQNPRIKMECRGYVEGLGESESGREDVRIGG